MTRHLFRSLALLLALAAAGPLAAQTEAILDNPYPVQAAWFGADVDVSSDRMIVGAPGGTSGTGIVDVGEAVVYEKTASGWVEMDRLVPTAGVVQRFGTGVAIDGDRAVVGAYAGGNPGQPYQGALYVFEYANGAWTRTAAIADPNGQPDDGFGYQVALKGDRIVASAPGDDAFAGSVQVYDLVGGTWTQTAVLTSPTAGAGDVLGLSLDFDGTTIVAGAPGQVTVGPIGKAVVWQHNGTAWFPYEITESDSGPNGRYGESVAVDGGHLAVGASWRTGTSSRDGAVYLYEQLGNPWVNTARLDGNASFSTRQLGYRVSMSDDRLAVAALSSTINTQVGAVEIYDYDGTSWTNTRTVTGSDATPQDLFGYGLALDGDVLGVGAYVKDPGGVYDAGATYVYDLATTPEAPDFLAADAITIGKATAFSGTAHSNGALTLNRQASGYSGSYAATLSASGDVLVDRRNVVDGDVTAGGALTVHPTATVTGAASGGASVAPIALPNAPTVIPSPVNKKAAVGQTLTVAPGGYGVLRAEGDLVLTAGTYAADKLVVRPGGTLTFDVTGGPILVDVKTKVVVARDAAVRVVSGGQEDASQSARVTVRSAQTDNLVIGARSSFVGALEAPLALVKLNADASLTGSVAAREIVAANRTSLVAHGAAAPAAKTGTPEAALAEAPEALALSAGPNPFRDAAEVSFALPEPADVRLAAYDALGREVAVLTDGPLAAGAHAATFHAGDLPAGVYVLRLTTPEATVTRRVTRVR